MLPDPFRPETETKQEPVRRDDKDERKKQRDTGGARTLPDPLDDQQANEQR
jgi:hypothetical protein